MFIATLVRSFVKMESYIKEHSEQEGHFTFYPDRLYVWDDFIENDLKEICNSFRSSFQMMHTKWLKKADGSLHFRIEWLEMVTAIADTYCSSEDNIHLRVIISTVAKYALKFLQKESSDMSHLPPVAADIPRKLPQQSITGIKILSGGILGKMFKLYKRHRNKHKQELQILCSMIVVDKQKTFIPVEQRCHDRGGLYVMKECYMSTIKSLDTAIREEFQYVTKHGKNIVKVRYYSIIIFIIIFTLRSPTLNKHRAFEA